MACIIHPVWISNYSTSTLKFFSNYLKKEELKEFGDFFETFLQNKFVAELFQKALKANNGELNVWILDTYISPAAWNSKNKAIILNLYKFQKLSAFEEAYKYTLKDHFLFELINAIHFADSVSLKEIGDFETEDEYALYHEQTEYQTYCLHRDTVEQLKTLGFFPNDHYVPPKCTFEELFKIVNQPSKNYALGSHIEAYRDRFRETKKASEEAMEIYKKMSDVYMSFFSSQYANYNLIFLQFALDYYKIYNFINQDINKKDKNLAQYKLLYSVFIKHLLNLQMKIESLCLSVEALKQNQNQFLISLQDTQNTFKYKILPKADKELYKVDLNEKIKLFSLCNKLIVNFEEIIKPLQFKLVQNLMKIEPSFNKININNVDINVNGNVKAKVKTIDGTSQPQTQKQSQSPKQNQVQNAKGILHLDDTLDLLINLFKDKTEIKNLLSIFFEINERLSETNFVKINPIDSSVKDLIVRAFQTNDVKMGNTVETKKDNVRVLITMYNQKALAESRKVSVQQIQSRNISSSTSVKNPTKTLQTNPKNEQAKK